MKNCKNVMDGKFIQKTFKAAEFTKLSTALDLKETCQEPVILKRCDVVIFVV